MKPTKKSTRQANYTRSLTAEHVRQHIGQSHALWGGGQTENARYTALMARLAGAGNDLLKMSGLTDGQGRLLASLKRYYFDLSIKGARVKTIGLGAIFTDSDLRGCGFATCLIKWVLEDAREKDGCGAALLFSDIGTAYYERFGFKALPSFSWKSRVSDLPEGTGLALREVGKDGAALIRWHADAAKGFDLYALRTERAYALFSEINGAGKSYLLSENGQDVGYVTMATGNALFWVDEWYAPEISPDKVWGAIKSMAQASGSSEAAGWWLPGYGVANKQREKEIPMVLIFNDENMPDGCLLSAVDHF